ncbi:MAG: LuxR C-terminal-related transcriptional regulator, partial [Oscillospiraceae bacterium]
VLEQNPCLHISCAWCAFFFGESEEVFYHLDRAYERIGDVLGANKALLQPVLLLYINDPRYPFGEQLDRLRAACIPPGADRENALKILNHKLPYFLRIYRDFTHYALRMEESFAEFRAVFSPLFKEHYAILESGMRSSLLYNQNRIRDALSLVTRDPAPDSLALTFLSRLQIAICLYAAGREEEADRCRRELASLIQSERLLHLQPILIAYDTKLKLYNGDRAAAKEWFGFYFVDPQPQFYKLFMHATTVRAHIVLGEYEKAATLCDKLRGLCAGYRRVLDVAEADVLLSILLWLTGRKEDALALLQRTLWEMQPYGYIRVFADEGKALLPLLKQVAKALDQEPVPDVAKRAFLREIYLAAYEQAKRHGGITVAAGQKPVKLSRRQKYVLELLAKGYKNAEIVALTGLSLNTIRYDTKIVYQKLDVTSSVDAVLRARAHRLIE